MAHIDNFELRKELLLKALDKYGDVDEALRAARRMERFILDGCDPSQNNKAEATEETAGDGPVATSEAGLSSNLEAGGLIEEEAPKTRKHASKIRWRHEDDTLLQKLFGEHRPVKEIAATLGRTPSSIYARIRLFKLKKTADRPQGVEGIETETRRQRELSKPSAEVRPARPKRNRERVAQLTLPRYSEEATVVIDEVVHFLRTRDYSVVSTEDGRYKIDGRRIMNAQELLQRANRIRESLGQTRWLALHEHPEEITLKKGKNGARGVRK